MYCHCCPLLDNQCNDVGSESYFDSNRNLKSYQQEIITRLLRNPVYKGGMYVHGTSKPTFKCKGRGYIKRADREVLEDVNEAIVTKEVWQTVQDIIDRHAAKAMKDKEKSIKSVLHSMNKSSAERSYRIKAEIDKLKARNAELDQMYIKLYEDYSGGVLSEKKFAMLSAHYEQEQKENEGRLEGLKKLEKYV